MDRPRPLARPAADPHAPPPALTHPTDRGQTATAETCSDRRTTDSTNQWSAFRSSHRTFTLRLAGGDAIPRLGSGMGSGVGPETGEHSSSAAGTCNATCPTETVAELRPAESLEEIAARLDERARPLLLEALQTLRALHAGRLEVEAKLRETGREDAIRAVTGASAIDKAIESTEAMIRALSTLAR